jgi:hypothetical protein
LCGSRWTGWPFSRVCGISLRSRSQQAVPHPLQAGRLLGGDQFHRFGEPHRAGNVLHAGAQVKLLKATVQDFLDGRPLADVEAADAPGAVDGVRGDGDQVHRNLPDVQRHAGEGMGGIGMEEDTLFPADFGNGADVLERANLLVGSLYGDQNGLRREGLPQVVQVHPSGLVHADVGGPEALSLQRADGVEDGEVLNGGGDDMAALLLSQRQRDALDGQVAGFGVAGSEDEFVGAGTQGGGDADAGVIQRFAGVQPDGVAKLGGRHGVDVKEIRLHRLQDPLVQAGSGGVIQVDQILVHGPSSLRQSMLIISQLRHKVNGCLLNLC